ncbi:MAG TPA: hypothetical protein VJ327_06225, partial [Patescibacteria group bacterium]|nr:hypothetical protein [Patescibacteria group bacterium]
GDAREENHRGRHRRRAGVGRICLGDRPDLKKHEDTQDHGAFAADAEVRGTNGEPSTALCGVPKGQDPRL